MTVSGGLQRESAKAAGANELGRGDVQRREPRPERRRGKFDAAGRPDRQQPEVAGHRRARGDPGQQRRRQQRRRGREHHARHADRRHLRGRRAGVLLPADRPGQQRRTAASPAATSASASSSAPTAASRSSTAPAGRRRPRPGWSPARPAPSCRSARAGSIRPTRRSTNSRKPLAGEFRWRGQTVFVIVNHFNSKGGDDPLFGRFQPPNRITETQRHAQAQIVNDFVDALHAVDSRRPRRRPR